MKKSLGYTVAFLVIFTYFQFVPITESGFSPHSPWDVLAGDVPNARTSVALGEIFGDMLFVGFILGIFYYIRGRKTSNKD
ncbi:MAG: hypothetical protein IH995_03330 [Proteobacteria bacterium]|nr:hypothetical protein [Pseudomonadota bacterium]